MTARRTPVAPSYRPRPLPLATALRLRLAGAGAALALAALSAPTPAGASSPHIWQLEGPRFAVELETGAVWQSRNDAQIPNDASGTRFSLEDAAGSGAWPAGRVQAWWRMSERQELRALAAPLSITETGVLDRAVAFAGAAYQPAVPTEATYKFNSYRVSYRYRFKYDGGWRGWVGFTAKLRDAKIELRQGATTSRKTDLGFVPLLHLAGDARLAPRWRLTLEADALAGGPGRAEDVAIKLARDLGDRWTLAAGYRTVEGGADVDEVYTFAWLHYAVASLVCRF